MLQVHYHRHWICLTIILLIRIFIASSDSQGKTSSSHGTIFVIDDITTAFIDNIWFIQQPHHAKSKSDLVNGIQQPNWICERSAYLIHWGRVTHTCVGNIGHHWFWSAPSHYLNQCWHIINCNIVNKLQWNFNRNQDIFTQEKVFEMSSGKWRPSHFGLNVLRAHSHTR